MALPPCKSEIDCAIRLSSALDTHNERCQSIPTHRLTVEVPLTGPTPILIHLIVLKVLKVQTFMVHQTLPAQVDPELATQVTNNRKVPRRAQIRNFGNGSKQSMQTDLAL
jgi:hypothetical protein